MNESRRMGQQRRQYLLGLGSVLCVVACRQSIDSAKVPNADPNRKGAGAPSSGKNNPSGKTDLTGLKVTLDIGHGDSVDIGAVANGLTEHTQNKIQAEIIEQILTDRGATVIVKNYPVATGDKVHLRSRGAAAVGTDAMISLHHNAGGGSAQGTETWVYNSRGNEGNDHSLAKAVQSAMCEKLWSGASGKDRGVKSKGFAVLAGTPASVPACVLTESYFIDGPGAKENGEKWSKTAAEGIAEGIANWHLSRSSGTALSLMEMLVSPFTQYEYAPNDVELESIYMKDH